MWGSQNWNQWAVQPAVFNDVPHEQIDWAALAKQWIQMQRTTQPPESGPPPHVAPNIPPPPHIPPGAPEEFPEGSVAPPLLKTPLPVEASQPFHSNRPFENEPSNTYWAKPPWGDNAPGDVDERLWQPPAIEPPPPASLPHAGPILIGKETYDYGHMHDNPTLAMQSVDYNHVSEFPYNPMYAPPPPPPPPPPEGPYDHYWQQINAAPNTIAPMFLKKERSSSNVQAEEDTSHIDAVKRKQLPAWIREGLEKMEQDRIKRIEKERAAKEEAEKLSKANAIKEELGLNSSHADVQTPTKSKFESDSDEEIENQTDTKKIQRSFSPYEEIKSEEEKRQEMMMKVKRMLTEVLLSVTNAEMLAIAQEVYRKALSKAPALQLASSTSMTALAPGLRGLASYGTESDASETDESSDSDEELHHRIKEKRKQFAIKERKIMAELERRELEEQERNETQKIKHENGHTTNKEYAAERKEETSNIEKSLIEETSLHNPKFLPNAVSSSSKEIPFISQENEKDSSKNDKNYNNGSSITENSSSSESSANSEEKYKKKYKEDSNSVKKGYDKNRSRTNKSPSRHSHNKKRSQSRESDVNKYGKNKSSNKKRKYERSGSSSSSGSITQKRKHNFKSDVDYRIKKKRSHSRDRERKPRSRSSSRHRHSKSPSKSYKSYSHRHDEREYNRKYKDNKKYQHSRGSRSPISHSHLPKKYRISRSLSSESEIPGKKLKTKSRNR